ncbi:MAG TPA: YciI family protein [Acidobacteriota bacterium]|nr:YciI family protein [Acidobacteriota bacterium]
MKSLRYLILVSLPFLLGFLALQAQEPPPGMASYYFVFLKAGSAELSEQESGEIMQAHVAHLSRQWEEGRLVASGPLIEAGELRGIAIYRTTSLEQARQAATSDPAVRAGLLQVRILTWWGPEGIGDGYKQWASENPGQPDPMKEYQLVLLKRGPKADAFQGEEARELQAAHLANIRKMAEAGQLLVAGPFLDGDSLRGIFVLTMDSVEEARQASRQDPAVQAGRLEMEIHRLAMAEGSFPKPELP